MPTTSQKKIDSEKQKAEVSTTKTHGFRVSGISIKDKEGKVILKLRKKESFVNKKEKDVKEMLISLIKSNDLKEINKKNVDYILTFIQNLREFFEKKFRGFCLRCASIFIIIDNTENFIQAKLIDFGNYYEEKNIIDENMIEGLNNLETLIKTIN